MSETPGWLRGMHEDAFDPERTAAFRAARRATEAWDAVHPVGLDDVLDCIASLHERFGAPPVDRRPWRGDDFRL